MGLVQNIKDQDYVSIRQAIAKLGSTKLGPTSSPTYAGLTLTGLDASEFVFTNASKALVSINVPLVVAYGGSGAATFTDHSILLGSGTDAFTALGAATNGQIPIGSTGADPVLATITGTSNEIDVTNAAGSITIGIVDPLIVGKGGSGAATFTDHSLLVGSGTDAFTAIGAATNGQLPIGSTGADPVLATLTGTANQINVTNAVGSITLSTPQDIHTGASPTFAGLITTGTIDASSGEVLIEDNATVEPTDKSDGYIGVAIIGGQPRLYWAVEGEMYYVEGSASVAIETGSPIGLLLVLTYNLE